MMGIHGLHATIFSKETQVGSRFPDACQRTTRSTCVLIAPFKVNVAI